MSYKFQYNRPNNPAQTTRICWTVQARMKQQQTLPNPWPTQRLSRWACPAGQPLLNSPIQTPDKHLTVQSLSISWYFHTLQHYQLHILLDTVWKRIIIELLIPLHIYIYICVLAAKPSLFRKATNTSNWFPTNRSWSESNANRSSLGAFSNAQSFGAQLRALSINSAQLCLATTRRISQSSSISFIIQWFPTGFLLEIHWDIEAEAVSPHHLPRPLVVWCSTFQAAAFRSINKLSSLTLKEKACWEKEHSICWRSEAYCQVLRDLLICLPELDDRWVFH